MKRRFNLLKQRFEKLKQPLSSIIICCGVLQFK